jgi:hypothetical protein
MSVPYLEDRFLLSIEQEYHTTVDGTGQFPDALQAIQKMLSTMSKLAPSLPGSSGFYNGYGRVYEDCGHVEFALAECDSPYQLVLINEQQQILAAQALASLRREGVPLRLFNNNHSGFLHPRSATWGSHENYLVELHPTRFTDLILPFLVTRLYGGSGGVRFPSGQFVASVRSEFMAKVRAGGTTRDRAIHSTCREEHLVGASQHGFRYHLIGADGHRSHFNLALMLGATALVLKAIVRDAELGERIRDITCLPHKGCWMRTLRDLNRLGKTGSAPQIDPVVWEVQRIYLESAWRTVAAMDCPPAWTHRVLEDWAMTLDAMESNDRPWLAAHLDAFNKYELYNSVLAGADETWARLRYNPDLFSKLALMEHSYHEFEDPSSVFDQAEAAGLLDHRVVARQEPGSEAEPHVPVGSTRSHARARFLAEHAGSQGMYLDWMAVIDRQGQRRCRLDGPFDESFGPWKKLTSIRPSF